MSRKKKDNRQPEGVPLDLRIKKTVNPVTKIVEEIPELNPVWAEDVQFVPYTPPPMQLSSASVLDYGGVEEWSERMAFINDDLIWLLSLPHNRFWCQVIFDETLQQCLDSYLRSAPRNFDVSSVLPPESASLHENVHKRVFMTYLRMSTHKESKEDFFTLSTFGDILYENFLFDIPKIMDICVLYGGESSANTPLLQKMLENIFSKQPKYHGDLNATIPTVHETLDDILSRCGIIHKTDDPSNPPQKLTDAKNGATASLSVQQLEDIVLYLYDTTETLLAFAGTYSPVCESFHRHGFVQRIASFYELITPYFRQHLTSDVESRTLKDKWKLVKVALIKLCRVILRACCVEPLEGREMNHNDDQVQSCIEDYLQVLTSILSEKRFLSSYDSRFSIREDLNRMQKSKASVDETRVDYILAAVDSARKAFPCHLAQINNGGKQDSGPIVDLNDADKSVNGRSDEWTEEHISDVNGFIKEKNKGATSKTVDEVELFSMITHIQDILPGLGDGFVILCIEELNYDVEQVINLLLEDNLPPSLENANRNLSKEELMKTRKQPVATVLEQRTLGL
ncbi:Activating signal cointegrator 1 complex subunit 2 [Desmophyllum pertusum]|uniref:Activating signal cointegrator 1 complex subunit 2 n=1 Tax=Desmophyllum pertusum TaxID=174260 RepID=A0A9X0CWC2_9CNID|nr:Activating signal cointegrator 1 complex subunit 2 [Desmophyllum pertusum]